MEAQLAADRVERAQQIEAVKAAQARSQAELAALEADAAQAKASLVDQVKPPGHKTSFQFSEQDPPGIVGLKFICQGFESAYRDL